jgi:hypothetical protein
MGIAALNPSYELTPVLNEFVPGKRTVAVLMNPDTPFSLQALRELKAAAEQTAQLRCLDTRTRYVSSWH